MDTLDRVRALINLAGDERTDLEEARTAALTAVRLIKRDGFDVSKSGGGFDVANTFDEILKSAVERASEEQETQRRWPDAGPSPKGRARSRASSVPKPSVLRAKSAGFCSVCGDTYAQGDRVVWLPDPREIVHVDCNSGRGRRPDIR